MSRPLEEARKALKELEHRRARHLGQSHAFRHLLDKLDLEPEQSEQIDVLDRGFRERIEAMQRQRDEELRGLLTRILGPEQQQRLERLSPGWRRVKNGPLRSRRFGEESHPGRGHKHAPPNRGHGRHGGPKSGRSD